MKLLSILLKERENVHIYIIYMYNLNVYTYYICIISLKFDSRLVKVYLTNNEKLQLRTADKEAFDQAENETFELDKIYALASDLSKKSDYVADILKKPEFIDEVKELAQVKLGQKLKDINDEVNSN